MENKVNHAVGEVSVKNSFPASILNSYWYIDRAHIWIKPELYNDKRFIEELRHYCANACYQVRYNGYAIHLSQPCPEAFNIVKKYNEFGVVFYLELAWDFISASQSDAEKFGDWMRTNRIELRRGSKKVCNFKSTRYSGNRHESQTTMYANKPSKISGEPCLHLEWRLHKARAVRSSGFFLESLVRLDVDMLQAYWRKRVRFVKVDLHKLGRFVLGRTRSKGRYRKEWFTCVTTAKSNKVICYDHFLRAGSILKRAYGFDVNGRFDLQILVDEVKRKFKISHADYTVYVDWPT